MTVRPHRSLLAWFLLAAALPAYANNPPRPDGMLGIVLLFPVAILGLRAAGAKRPERSRTRRLLGGLLLAFCTLIAMAGTGIAVIPLIILLTYGLFRSGEAMRLGQGGKRWAIGGAMMLFTLFAVANYLASLNYPTGGDTESMASYAIREIASTQIKFRADVKLDRNSNGTGEFGTLEQIQSPGANDDLSRMLRAWRGYRFAVVVTGDPARDEKEFFVYATPLNYGDVPWRLSMLDGFGHRKFYARRIFAVDESGVIRAMDLGGSRAVTREETKGWPVID